MNSKLKKNFIKLNYILSGVFALGILVAISYEAGICKNKPKRNFCKYINNSKVFKPLDKFRASMSETLKILLSENFESSIQVRPGSSRYAWETRERFKNYNVGFDFFFQKGSRQNSGFLILSTYPNNPINLKQKHKVEIWDINNQSLIHTYFHEEELEKYPKEKLYLRHYLHHPILEKDGSLVFHRGSKLVRIDKCSNTKNYSKNKKEVIAFHHSLEKDELGNFYTPAISYDFDKEIHRDEFLNDGFAILNSDLELIFNQSLFEIYKTNNLLHTFFGTELSYYDPFHINDVQPFIRSDGKKIVLLSVRNNSSIVAVEVESGKIIWIIENATSYQHDVDITGSNNDFIDISIFNNNTYRYKKRISKGNQIISFSKLPTKPEKEIIFINDDISFQKYNMKSMNFSWMQKEERPRTVTGGLLDFVEDNDSLMIEEMDFGRLFEIDIKNNKLLWQYVNKEKLNSTPFYLKWSRRLNKLPGDLNKESFKSCKLLKASKLKE